MKTTLMVYVFEALVTQYPRITLFALMVEF